MSTSSPDRRARSRSWSALLAVIAITGSVAFVGAAVALARSLTLSVERNVHVTNAPTKAFRVRVVNRHETVAVGPTGYALYTFQGETTHHIICKKTSSQKTNCWAFWPPLSVASARALSKPARVPGKLGTFRNHGTLQVTLNGQPLYYFTPDIQSGNRHQALGDELKTFGSIWHVVKAG